jgi:hypothetical protein
VDDVSGEYIPVMLCRSIAKKSATKVATVKLVSVASNAGHEDDQRARVLLDPTSIKVILIFLICHSQFLEYIKW